MVHANSLNKAQLLRYEITWIIRIVGPQSKRTRDLRWPSADEWLTNVIGPNGSR